MVYVIFEVGLRAQEEEVVAVVDEHQEPLGYSILEIYRQSPPRIISDQGDLAEHPMEILDLQEQLDDHQQK